MHEFKGQELVIEPLAHFPVVKDLVVNIDDFMHKLVSVKPWIIRDKETPVEEGETSMLAGTTGWGSGVVSGSS